MKTKTMTAEEIKGIIFNDLLSQYNLFQKSFISEEEWSSRREHSYHLLEKLIGMSRDEAIEEMQSCRFKK